MRTRRLREEAPKLQMLISTRQFRLRRLVLFPVIIITLSMIYSFKNQYVRNAAFFMDDALGKRETTKTPLPPLLPGVLDDPSRRLTRKLPVSHAFIVSAYYYPTSKSLGTNAVAVNIVVDSRNFKIERSTFYIVGSNETHAQLSVANTHIEKALQCRYASAVSIGNTVTNMTKLEMQTNGVKVEIPFKMARYEAPKPVIICISPQFLAEQWQLFMMQVHVAKKFGGHIHIYLTSIIESYFELMKEYEKLGYLTIDFWLRMKFDKSETPYFEPNANTEERNRAGAHTDCLLQYKEAAKYIAFFDLDDILFPTKHSTYLSEFNAEWKLQPNASSLYYMRKEHEFAKTKYLSEFSFQDIVSSLKSSDTLKPGKYILRPYEHNFTWIHTEEFTGKIRTVEESIIIHIFQKSDENSMSKTWKIDFVESKEKKKMRKKDLKLIGSDISRIREFKKIKRISRDLPSSDYFVSIVSQCYYDALHPKKEKEKSKEKSCQNIDTCEITQKEGLKCVHSDAEYVSGPHMEPITFHFSNNSFWNSEIGCYQ